MFVTEIKSLGALGLSWHKRRSGLIRRSAAGKSIVKPMVRAEPAARFLQKLCGRVWLRQHRQRKKPELSWRCHAALALRRFDERFGRTKADMLGPVTVEQTRLASFLQRSCGPRRHSLLA